MYDCQLVHIQREVEDEMAANVKCNNGSIAASTASVAFAWSVLRWRDVFGDVAMDTLRRHASSQRWSVLGSPVGVGPAHGPWGLGVDTKWVPCFTW